MLLLDDLSRRSARWPTLVSFLLLTWLVLACAPAQDAAPRQLEVAELALLEVEGGVAKWLPIRFSAVMSNPLPALTITEVTFEVGGKTVSRSTRIPPGEQRRLRMQWLFPEDEQFGEVDDPEAVAWRLVAARVEPAGSS